MAKGQSAIEFVALAGIMFLFFATAIVYVQGLIVDLTQASKEQQLMGVRDAIVDEIALANRMPLGYSRTFDLPYTIQGLSYVIVIENETAPLKDSIFLTTYQADSLTYLEYDINGTLAPGTNTIRKTTLVQIN